VDKEIQFPEESDPKRRRKGPCELCGTKDKELTFHHLIPKSLHRKKKFKNRYSIEEMRSQGLFLCRKCHSGIHDLIPSEKELGESYNTKARLLAHEGVAKHVAWASKQK
jgi:5-methylcytosine-specific restriction endonuclease McrA